MTRIEAAPRTPPVAGVLLGAPDHFQVVDVKNAFMQGQQGRVDRARALRQWAALADAYRAEGLAVHVLDALPGVEDLVFTANPACVVPRPEGGADVVLSRMRHASRQREVAHVGDWLGRHGLRPRELPAGSGPLEGHGDVLVVPGRRFLLGGHGGRTERAALTALEKLLDVPVVQLPLVGAIFYHLDTALALLDERTVLLHPPAFEPAALATLARLFPLLVEADPREAREELACNVHALANGAVLCPAQAPRTAERIAAAGFRPAPVDVSEFHRSGGSVFCLKLELP